MAERVVIDPITRIEGHLRIELETANSQITKAWSETTQFRGLETILQGRDPRDAWAFVGRICGVCTSVHAIASINAVENAIGSNPPEQALRIRDIVLGAQEIQDHVIHFYHLHALDFVDVAACIDADPAKAVAFAQSIGSNWKGNNLTRMTAVRDTVKSIVESGQLSVFTNGYWGHPDYRLPPEANLMAVAHYLDALEFQRSMIRIVTVFGGKNPHPNFLVGGMACAIDPNHSESINQVQLDAVQGWINECVDFVTNCYVPDALAIAGVYKDYFDIGAAQPDFLAVGLTGATYAGDPANARVKSVHTEVEPGVVHLDGDKVSVEAFDPAKITEWASSAWYEYAEGDVGLTPDKGETTVKYTGPKPPYTAAPNDGLPWLSDNPEYTWCKAPRYDGYPVQVGPVARILLGYARGHARTKEIVTMAAQKLGITIGQLNSTAGRTLARAAECLLAAELLANESFPTFVANLKGGDIDVFDASKWEPSSWPSQCSGYSFVEVARGNLSHWVTIENGKISRYQCVVPTTWLAGGRDAQGQQGPYEESLAGNGKHPLADPTQPLEPLRTIHSFDPCMSCAVHVLDVDGQEMAEVLT
ncbi:MAG: nickel-dependent hydrogenase large subunit [Propionibacteriaceae bacterium]|jgi:hydrogenase large subunit|nr:nickel-dependent hydrogenase large subunit [Propionibacteriaceae bacterium]